MVARKADKYTHPRKDQWCTFVKLELLQIIKYYFCVFNVLNLINEYCATTQMTVRCPGSHAGNLEK